MGRVLERLAVTVFAAALAACGGQAAQPAVTASDGGWEDLPDSPVAGGRASESGAAVAHDRLVVWRTWDAAANRPTFESAVLMFDDWRWHPVREPPVSPAGATLAVWSGSELLLLGGDHTGTSTVVIAYDAARDHWRRLASPPVTLMVQTLTLMDDALLVVGLDADFAPRSLVYDVDADRWRKAPSPPGEPLVRWAIWTGEVALTMIRCSDGTPAVVEMEQLGACLVAYDPAASTWIRRQDPPHVGWTSAAWHEDALVVLGMGSPLSDVHDMDAASYPYPAMLGARYVAVDDAWEDLEVPNELASHAPLTVFAQGRSLVAWHPRTYDGDAYAEFGAIFTLAEGWRPIPCIAAPNAGLGEPAAGRHRRRRCRVGRSARWRQLGWYGDLSTGGAGTTVGT